MQMGSGLSLPSTAPRERREEMLTWVPTAVQGAAELRELGQRVANPVLSGCGCGLGSSPGYCRERGSPSSLVRIPNKARELVRPNSWQTAFSSTEQLRFSFLLVGATLELGPTGEVQLRENSPWHVANRINTFLHFNCTEKSWRQQSETVICMLKPRTQNEAR